MTKNPAFWAKFWASAFEPEKDCFIAPEESVYTIIQGFVFDGCVCYLKKRLRSGGHTLIRFILPTQVCRINTSILGGVAGFVHRLVVWNQPLGHSPNYCWR